MKAQQLTEIHKYYPTAEMVMLTRMVAAYTQEIAKAITVIAMRSDNVLAAADR